METSTHNPRLDISRRNFLRMFANAGLAMAAAPLAGCSTMAGEKLPSRTASAVDIHHHFVPPIVLEEAGKNSKALGVEVGKNKDGQPVIYFLGTEKKEFLPDFPPLEQRLGEMQKGKVAVVVAEPSTPGLGYALAGEKGEVWCKLYNEGLRELVRQNPGRFGALAAVPLQDPPRAAKVLEHAIAELKLSGVMIASNVNGKYYNTKDFDPFWQKAQELDVMVLLHPDNIPGGDVMRAYGMLTICGNPADTTLSLGYMVYSGVFERFPNLKICGVHGGGFFPYHLGRFDRGFARSRPGSMGISKPPSAYLKNLYFDTLVYRVDTLDYLRRLAGANHLLFGTDYPNTLGDWMGVDKVEGMNCREAEKEAILHGNARRLLRLS